MGKCVLLFWILFFDFQGVLLNQIRSHWLGTPVPLTCLSEKEVHCIWLWNEKPINITNRYRFLSSTGKGTKYCSIIINLFHEEDVGNWSCWSMSTDKGEGELLDSYTLTLKTKQNDAYLKTSPRSVDVERGKNVTLQCQFLVSLMQCNWLRNEQPISVVGRYKYRGEGCSLDIVSALPIDAGAWRCTTCANNGYEYIQSKTALLSITGTSNTTTMTASKISGNVLERKPENQSVSDGDTVVLNCIFRNPVECVWFRKNQVIHVGYRYGYAGNNSKGEKIRDCSLKIRNVQMIDHGSWRCFGAANDSTDSIPSNEAFIFLKRNPSNAAIHHHPKDVATHLGRQVTFDCKFNRTVYCVWKRNGKVVLIEDRYVYVGKTWKNTTDCSIVIHSVDEIDFGTWSCQSLASYTDSNMETTEVTMSALKMPFPPAIFLDDGRQVTVLNTSQSNRYGGNFTCVSKGGNPAPQLSWTIDGQLLTETNSTSQEVANGVYDGHLELESSRVWATYGNVSVLKCIASHPAFSRNRSAELMFRWMQVESKATTGDVADRTIYIKPVIVKHPKDTYAKLGSSVTLDCVFDRTVNCEWYHITRKHEFVRRFPKINISNDCSLNITEFQESDFGTFACLNRKNLPTVMSNTVFLYKQAIGEVVIKWQNEPVTEVSLITYEKDAALTCHGMGNPSPQLQWFINGQQYISTRNETYQQSAFEMQHIVIYWDFSRFPPETLAKTPTSLFCLASHPMLEIPLSAAVLLKMNKAPIGPVILLNDTIFTEKRMIIYADNLNMSGITCSCENGYPAARLSWMVDGRNISGITKILNGSHDGLLTTVLQWQTPDEWNIPSGSTTTLKCIATHPEFSTIHAMEIPLKIKTPKVYAHVSSTVGFNEQPVSLECLLERPTDCCWKLNGRLTNPERDGYQYDMAPYGKNATDCSITIPRFMATLAGRWQCCSKSVVGYLGSNYPETLVTLPKEPLGPDIWLKDKKISKLNPEDAHPLGALSCTTFMGNPPYEVQWALDGKRLPGKYKVDHHENFTDYNTNIFWNDNEWDLLKNASVLSCIATESVNGLYYKTTFVTITKPFDSRCHPVIMINNTAVTNGKLVLNSTGDLRYLKCVSSMGNSIPHLYWELNGKPIPESFNRNRPGEHGLFTVELKWVLTEMQQNQIKDHAELSCVKETDNVENPCFAKIAVTFQKSADTVENAAHQSTDNSGSISHEYLIIGISTQILLLLIAGVIVAVCFRFRRHLKARASCRSCYSGLLAIFDQTRPPKDEPLVAYSTEDNEEDSGITPIIGCE